MDQSLRPLATVGAAAMRPTSMRRSRARPVSSPPSRSSSVALRNDPMTTSVSGGCSAWPSQVPDSASRGTPTGTALLTAPASLSATPSSASTASRASTALLATSSPRGYLTSGDDLCGLAGVDPLAEDGDALGGPCSVTRHRAGFEPAKDGVGVGRDVLGRPEIEGEAHGGAVALAEQRLDVLLEAHRLVLLCGGGCLRAAGCEATGRAPVGEVP